MRFVILLASLVVQVCLGGLYAWTTFVPALESSCGLSLVQTQVVFGTLIAVFTIAMVFTGRVLEARGPRLLLVLSGVLFAAGYTMSSFCGTSFWLLLLGIGGVVGVATGLGYVCPLSTCMKWFPRHKGLVTGIAVAGFGGGAVVLANVGEVLLGHGVEVLTLFRWVGLVYGVAIAASAIVMRFPPQDGTQHAHPAHLNVAAGKDPFFWAMVSALFCGTFAGLLVIGNLMPMALASGVSVHMAALGISGFAVGNAAGRITWGRVVDRMGTKTIPASLAYLAAAMVFLVPALTHGVSFIIASLLVGFGFGSCFVIHAALVASRYGPNRVGSVYPLVFLAYGAAGITGPVVGGWLYDLTGRCSLGIEAGIAVVVAGLLASGFLVRRSRRDPY